MGVFDIEYFVGNPYQNLLYEFDRSEYLLDMCKQAVHLQSISPSDPVGLGISYKTYPHGSSSLYWDRSYNDFFYIPESVNPTRDVVQIFYDGWLTQSYFSLSEMITGLKNTKANRLQHLKQIVLKTLNGSRFARLHFGVKNAPCLEPFFSVQDGFQFFDPRNQIDVNWQGEGF